MTIFASLSKLAAASSLAIAGLAAASTAAADLSDLRGTWVNSNANTRGLTQVIIGGQGDLASMKAWGSCHPSDCAWGEVAATPLTASVSASPASADRVLATYDVSFKTSILSAYRQGDQLVVENATTFKDGRADTFHRYTFDRKPMLLAPSVIGAISSLNPTLIDPTIILTPTLTPVFQTTPLEKLAGQWTNIDGNTRGMTALDIKVNGASAEVRAWGSCSPRDCDWGWTAGTPLTASVSDDPQDANSLYAVWDSRIATRTAVMTRDGDRLNLQISTVYKDDRSDRLNTYVFTR